MDQIQHELLLYIESAIVILENKSKKSVTEQEVYQKLLLVREKAKQISDRKALELLVEAVKSFFK